MGGKDMTVFEYLASLAPDEERHLVTLHDIHTHFFNFNPKPTRLPSGVTDDDQDDVEVKGEVTKPAVCPRCGSSRIEPSRDRDKHWFCKGCGWEK